MINFFILQNYLPSGENIVVLVSYRRDCREISEVNTKESFKNLKLDKLIHGQIY